MKPPKRGHRDTLEVGKALDLERGHLLGERYRVVRELGAGAMGVVYEVADEQLEERVALKLLHPHLWGDDGFRAQLRTEVRLARRVSHPNVCRIHDLGHHQEALFVTMELVPGESLRQLLRRGETPALPKKVDLLVQLCSALAAAHHAGVLHRDVKPDNVLVADERAVLTDFGVASLVSDSRGRTVAGTAAYMAPELAAGQPPDVRADVYSTAVLAYELLAGTPPFPISTVAACLEHAESPLTYPPLHPGSAPTANRSAIDEVLSQALSANPAKRPQRIDIFAEALARAARGETAGAKRTALGRDRIPSESEAGARRVRVVTALAFRPTGVVSASHQERVVLDWGGTILNSGEESTPLWAVFGAPTARGDDALRAARAGLDLIARFEGIGAIDTARVTFQLAADGSLIGLQRAFGELEALMGKSGELGCSEATVRHIEGHFVLVGRGDDHSGRPRFAVMPARAKAASSVTALVGRDSELELLEAKVRVAFEERRPVLVQLSGEAGIGKSRLVRELERRISARREVDWLVGHGSPTAAAAPLLVLRTAAPTWYRAATQTAAHLSSDASFAARAWLLERTARRPLVWVIDDAHWADRATLELAESLPTTARNEPIAVVVVGRKRVVQSAPEIALTALSREHSVQVVGALAPHLEPHEVAGLALKAAGNPLFLEELSLNVENSKQVPLTIEAAVQGRIDRLTPKQRQVVTACSVLGPVFSAGIATQLFAERDPSSAATAMDFLVENGELIAVGSELRFASPMVADIALAQLDPAVRKDLHRRAARALEAAHEHPGRSAALGHHWLAAGDEARGRHWYRLAGREALGLHAYRDALACLKLAEVLTPTAERDAELLELVGDALVTRDAAAAEQRFELARMACDATDHRGRAELRGKLAQTAVALANYEQARGHLETGLGLLDESRESLPIKARLLAQLGWVRGYIQGDNREGLEASERAVAILEQLDDKPSLARALGRLGANYMRAGRWRDQLECNLRNLSLAKELGDLRGELTANLNLGVNYTSLGDIELALSHTFAALEIATRDGHSNVEPVVRNNLAGLLIERGDVVTAASQISEAIEHAREVGQLYILPEAHCIEARLALIAGDFKTARQRATAAVEAARATASTVDLGSALRHLAAVCGRVGHSEEAERLFAEARELLAAADPFEYARTLVAEGKSLRESTSSSQWRRSGQLMEEGREILETLGAARDLECLEVEDDFR